MNATALSEELGVVVERVHLPKLIKPSDPSQDRLGAKDAQGGMVSIAAAAGTFGLGILFVLVADRCKHRWKKYLKKKGDTGPHFERRMGGSEVRGMEMRASNPLQ